jgi:hypothetical protein
MKLVQIMMMVTMIKVNVRYFRKLYFIVFLCSFPPFFTGQSQERYEWISATVTYDLPKKFNFNLTEEARLRNISGSLLNQMHTDFELGYKVHKRVDVACIYRFAQKREDNHYFYSRHRFTAQASYDNKYKRLEYTYRARYQYQTKRYKEDIFDEIPDQYLRNRLKLTYNIRKTKVEPYLSYEIFSPLNRYKEQVIDEFRIGLGARIPINKRNRLDAGLLYNYEMDNSPVSAWIITIGYRFEAN